MCPSGVLLRVRRSQYYIIYIDNYQAKCYLKYHITQLGIDEQKYYLLCEMF